MEKFSKYDCEEMEIIIKIPKNTKALIINGLCDGIKTINMFNKQFDTDDIEKAKVELEILKVDRKEIKKYWRVS